MPSALAVLRLITNSYLVERLYRQVGRFLALEDAIDVAGTLSELSDNVSPIGDQATATAIEAAGINRRQ